MSSRLKILLGVAAVLTIALALFDWNWFRKPLENYLSRESRRSVSIGDLHVTLGMNPTLRVRQLRVENAPWADTTKPLIVAGQASFTLSLRTLWDERKVLSRIVLRDAEVDMERQADGRRNWRLVDPDYTGPPKVKVLSLEAERSTLRFVNRGAELDLMTAASEPGPDNKDPRFTSRIDFSGSYEGVKFSGSTLTRNPLTFWDTRETFPLLGHMQWRGNRMDVDGVMADLWDPSVIDAKVRIAGPSLASLPPIVRFGLPATRPYRLETQVRQSDTETTAVSGHGNIGSTDVAGEGSYSRTKPRPMVRASVRSASADTADFGLANVEEDRRFFSATKLEAARLGSRDAHITLEAGKLKAGKAFTLEQLRLTAVLDGGLLHLKPVAFGLAGGRVAADLTVDVREGPVASRASADFRAIALERLFPALASVRGTGPVNAQLRLAGVGDSIAAQFGSASGEINAAMGAGRISNLADAKLALNGGKILLLKLRGDQDIGILCGAAGIEFSKGSGRFRKLVLDTEQTRVRGTGSVDLRAEKFEVRLIPQAKQTEWLPLGSAIRIEGTLKHADVSVDKGKAGSARAPALDSQACTASASLRSPTPR